MGRLVKSFSLATCYSLLSTVVWHGTDDFGRNLPPGVYFCRLEIDKTTVTTKIIKLE